MTSDEIRMALKEVERQDVLEIISESAFWMETSTGSHPRKAAPRTTAGTLMGRCRPDGPLVSY